MPDDDSSFPKRGEDGLVRDEHVSRAPERH